MSDTAVLDGSTGETNPETEETVPVDVGDEENLTEAERRAIAEGRKKHSRPVITMEVDGQTVLAEKVWGSALFPKDIVREFAQYCRDTDRKASEVLEEIIRKGLAPVFKEVQATKAQRDATRSIRRIAADEDALKKAAEKLKAKEDALKAQMAAIRVRAAQIKEAKGEGAVDVLAAILGTDEPEEQAPVPETPRNGKRGKK